MKDYKIYCLDDSELADYEATSKGFRGDIYIHIDENYYHLNIYDPIRLRQDFDTEVEHYGYFAPEPNLVLTTEVSQKEILSLVENLVKQKYFEQIKPVGSKRLNQLDLLDFS